MALIIAYQSVWLQTKGTWDRVEGGESERG